MTLLCVSLGDFHKPIGVSGMYMHRQIVYDWWAEGLKCLSLNLVLFLLIAHVILLLHLSSYFRTIFTKHKPIPSEVWVCACVFVYYYSYIVLFE